jgi:uncharacterized membrane protein
MQIIAKKMNLGFHPSQYWVLIQTAIKTHEKKSASMARRPRKVTESWIEEPMRRGKRIHDEREIVSKESAAIFSST